MPLNSHRSGHSHFPKREFDLTSDTSLQSTAGDKDAKPPVWKQLNPIESSRDQRFVLFRSNARSRRYERTAPSIHSLVSVDQQRETLNDKALTSG